MSIYICNLYFPNATKYITITLIARSFEEARIKFISKCMAKYDDIKNNSGIICCQSHPNK